MIGLKLVEDAKTEPVSLDEAKAFLAIDSSDTGNDALISALIKAARQFCESYTKRAIITQTWEFWLDRFPKGHPASRQWWDGTREGSVVQLTGSLGVIEIPKAPLQSLVSLETYGTDDQASSFDLSNLIVINASVPARVFPKVGQIWTVNLRPNMAVHLTFKAGYGDTGDLVPSDLVHACKMMVGHFFENREPQVEGKAVEAPLSVRAILDSYVVRSIA